MGSQHLPCLVNAAVNWFERGSHSVVQTGAHCITQAGLKLTTFFNSLLSAGIDYARFAVGFVFWLTGLEGSSTLTN